MQVTKIMLAVAALSAGATAFAAPPAAEIAYSSGASATKANIKLALNKLCLDAGGVSPVAEFTSGGNISTYVCSTTANLDQAGYNNAATVYKKFNGTGFSELRLNVSGGSFTAVCLLNALSLPANATTISVFPAGACASVNAGGAADRYRNPANATDEFAPNSPARILGGLMDVAPTTWPSNVLGTLNTFSTADTGVGQTFGVAVTDTLYNAMYAAQRASSGGATVDKPIPSSCPATPNAASYTQLECVPTISRGQMATIMANNEFNAAYSNGAGFLAGSALNGVTLEYNRRADTSGTQAAAQAYFLGLPCTPNPLSIVDAPAVGSSATIGAIKVYAHAGTGDVRTRLNVAGVYGIGIMSGENNQTDVNTTWKWLRLQGAPIGESAKTAAGVTNRSSVTSGNYDFYFESKSVTNAANPAAGTFFGAVSTALNGLGALGTGLLNSSDLATYNKGSNACQYNSSN